MMNNTNTNQLVASALNIDLWSMSDGWAVYADGELVVADVSEKHARGVARELHRPRLAEARRLDKVRAIDAERKVVNEMTDRFNRAQRRTAER